MKLVDSEYDINEMDIVRFIQHGDTPLHLAAYHNYTDIYDILKSRGADVSIKNKV